MRRTCPAVLSARGERPVRRSPVGKLVLGSNAQRLLLELPVPILAVKPSA